MDDVLFALVALCGIIACGWGIYRDQKEIEADNNSASQFMKSRHRVIHPRNRKPIWKEDVEEDENGESE